MKELLITGGLGFLGSYTIEKFRDEYNITIIDNLSTNTLDPTDSLLDEAGCDLIIQDILEYDWETSRKFDLIIHLASPVGPVEILRYPGYIAQMIMDEVYWVIEGTQKFDCPLLFVSTSEIYGHRNEMVFLKEDDPKVLIGGDVKVRNEYAMAKLLSEIVLSNISKVSDIKYHIVRPFNIAGPRQLTLGGFVLPTFFEQALSDEDMTVFYGGSQVRSFTHAKDIVNGMYMLTKENVPYNQIWNIGNKENVISIESLAKKIKAITNSDSEISFVDPKEIHGPLYEEAWDKVPDAAKISEALGWKPEYNLDDIIKDIHNYYKNYIVL